MDQQSSRVLVVTGGASGIGKGIARYFGERQCRVAVADCDRQGAARLVETMAKDGATARAFVLDIRDEPAVQGMMSAVVAEWSRIDVLCNNAGVGIYKLLGDYSSCDWKRMLEVNLEAAFLCSKYALPALRETRGSILNISSIEALACEPQIAPYAASKAALLALTRGTALDYAKDGVRVNAICPGPVESRMTDEWLEASDDPAALRRQLESRVPLGRIGTPEDIAAAAWFLASPQASFITGATLVVDGGALARLAL